MFWSDTPNNACIFWLNGMAGTGKSTIARTVAREWAKKERLGASFFFSRGQGDRAHASKFFTTLAYQLAYAQPKLAACIHKAICDRPDIPRQSLREQWKHLILEPLCQLSNLSPQLQSLILVIDALDECDGGNDDGNDTGLILGLLSEAKTLSSVRLQVFVTSRPETPIRHGFNYIPNAAHRDFILHEISKPMVNRDISALFQHEFDRIRMGHRLPTEWPDEPSLGHLIQKADGLFIYAATVCRFIGHEDSYPPERLTFVLEGSMDDGSPTVKLDLMYTKLLRYAVVKDREPQRTVRLLQRFRRIVGSIVILLDVLSASALGQLLATKPREVERTLESLRSMLSYSDSEGSPIRLLHPSFRDFLLDNRRCDDPRFSIVGDIAHGDLAVSCLELMSRHLKQDMCSLKLPGSLASEVDPSTVQRCLPNEVQYACRYWVDHLQRSNVKLCDGNPLHDWLHAFLNEHFLHWLEALSLIGTMHGGVLMVKVLDSMLTVSNPKDFERFLFLEIRNLAPAFRKIPVPVMRRIRRMEIRYDWLFSDGNFSTAIRCDFCYNSC